LVARESTGGVYVFGDRLRHGALYPLRRLFPPPVSAPDRAVDRASREARAAGHQRLGCGAFRAIRLDRLRVQRAAHLPMEDPSRHLDRRGGDLRRLYLWRRARPELDLWATRLAAISSISSRRRPHYPPAIAPTIINGSVPAAIA